MAEADLAVDSRSRRLRQALGDRIILRGEPEYDTARTPWNTAVDQRPFAVARPHTAEEVAGVIRAAVETGLRVAPQTTGHAAGALAGTDLSETVLLSLSLLRGVTVDPTARTARVLGGSSWTDVVAAAAPHGLTALHGSAGDVGVVGYTLSGGLSFYARSDGLAVNDVRAIEVVNAAGELARADAEENAELFWALRGGSGAFGAVVAIEISLHAYPDVFAGMLLWDAARAPQVARAWGTWTSAVPESATSTLRIMHFPPLPDLPPFLSGRSVVIVDGALLETDAAASVLLEPLRALAPEMDTFARIPAAALLGVHMDPPTPTPASSEHAMLSSLPAEAVEAFLAAGAIPGVFIAELRHLGGAVSRRPDGAGAVGSIDGSYLAHAIAVVPTPEAAPGMDAAVRAAITLFEPWHVDSLALTFIDSADADRAAGFGASTVRLRELKARFDPNDVLAAAVGPA